MRSGQWRTPALVDLPEVVTAAQTGRRRSRAPALWQRSQRPLPSWHDGDSRRGSQRSPLPAIPLLPMRNAQPRENPGNFRFSVAAAGIVNG